MTTHSDAQPPPASPEQVSGAGDLIAAVPAFLGFMPHRSLVLICLDQTNNGAPTIGTVMRHELVLFDGGHTDNTFGRTVSTAMVEVTNRFAEFCARNGVRAALGLIVDDRARTDSHRRNIDGRFRAVARRLADDMRGRGTELREVYLAAELLEGSQWWSLLGRAEGGRIPDPRTSPVALAYLLEGRGVHESRDALARTLDPVDTAVSRVVAELIQTNVTSVAEPDSARLGAILAQVVTWASTSPDRPPRIHLAPGHIAEFGASLGRVMVRDSLLAIALTGFADVAEQLWTFLMRTLPAPERACPATLLGFSAYARGEGTVAAVAIDVALEADPEYSLALLLDRSLLAGARPEMIREVALSGYAVAELLGVQLPPPLT